MPREAEELALQLILLSVTLSSSQLRQAAQQAPRSSDGHVEFRGIAIRQQVISLIVPFRIISVGREPGFWATFDVVIPSASLFLREDEVATRG